VCLREGELTVSAGADMTGRQLIMAICEWPPPRATLSGRDDAGRVLGKESRCLERLERGKLVMQVGFLSWGVATDHAADDAASPLKLPPPFQAEH